MKFIAVLLIALMSVTDASAAAARRAARTSGGGAKTTTSQQNSQKQSPQKQTMGARAATNSRTAPRATGGAAPKTGGRTTAARAAKPAAGKTGGTSAPVVSARAGTMQKAVSSGTQISTATKNTVVDSVCQEKFNGCMDAFCMLDNANGGRCTCSEKSIELNAALAEIEARDAQSYKLATAGVERIEMGANADQAIKMAQEISSGNTKKSSGDRKLSFDTWDVAAPALEKTPDENDVSGKIGTELHNMALSMCKAQIPECASSFTILQTLYAQQIRSDCLAYENTIKKRRTESDEKQQAAESAVYNAALEQYQLQNKYDLGQCAGAFKECMQTTAGCGEDFAGCTLMAANDNTNTRKSSANTTKTYTIQGTAHNVDIYASTYDTLIAKKPICEHVTKQCVDVAASVWDTFLREAASEIKAAESIAENNMRQNCISDVSNCFQKACKDTMDPNDPDGSYDMCLSRPETMLNVCKIPLNACGINANSKAAAQKSDIWQFILARLSSMRTNACTNQIKECFASDDRCGPDYTGCIGLDMDTIIDMCPMEKLTACDSSEYGGSIDEKLEYVYNVASGIFLNIDNNLLKTCNAAITNKMMEICGSTKSCISADVNQNLGRGSLQTAQQPDGNYIISGTIDFNRFKFTQPKDVNKVDLSASDPENYAYQVTYDGNSGSGTTANRIKGVIADINREVNLKISMLAMDPTINMCLTGRDMSQIVRGRDKKDKTTGRFPNLLAMSANTIFNSLINIARMNYVRDYASELSNANSMAREYRNMLMCASMAELNDKFTDPTETLYGIIDSDDWFVKLSGTNTADQMEVLKNGTSRTTPICTGPRNAKGDGCAGGSESFMIATEERTAFYEPGPQACRITVRLYACTGYEAIYEQSSSSWGVDTSVGFEAGPGDVEVGAGFSTSKSGSTHKGQFCNKYAEPAVTEQIIKFAGDEAVFGNVTHGNLENSYYNSSSVSNITDKSWSVSASLALNDSHDTTVTGDNATVNVTDNSSLVKKNKTKNINKESKCKKNQVQDADGTCRDKTEKEKCDEKNGHSWDSNTQECKKTGQKDKPCKTDIANAESGICGDDICSKCVVDKCKAGYVLSGGVCSPNNTNDMTVEQMREYVNNQTSRYTDPL